MLDKKNVLLGVCGSIACYKSAILVRLLIKAGANVRVVMTPDARNFITPLTLSTLSKNPVYTDYFDPETGEWHNHIELGIWADMILIAPLSANTLAKLATGICDNLLTAVYLSARCPVYVSPAMDLDMWKHASTQDNVRLIQQRGNILIPPGYGELASGLIGEGRMPEPIDLIAFLERDLRSKAPLSGKKVFLTAGPTYEAIDPVRFIGNHSSGKMGFALAEELARQGAEVTLVTGPVSLKLSNDSIHRIDVTNAQEMLEASLKAFPETDIAILAAAVADYRPVKVANQKIKKQDARFNLELEKTTDILATLGKIKLPHQLLIGFALETENEVANAFRKLEEKNLDLIILNSLRDPGAAFKNETNKITIISRDKNIEEFQLKSKSEVAADISRKLIALIK